MTGSFREVHKRQTADILVDAALELFEQHGFDAVTIEQIAADAGVSARTFYRYFPTKESVLYPDRDELLSAMRDAVVSAAPSLPAWTVLKVACLVMADTSADRREMQRRRGRVALDEASIERYERTVLMPATEAVLSEAFAERLEVDLDEDPRPRLLAGLGLAVMAAVGKSWLASGGVGDVDAHIYEVFDLAAALTVVDGPRDA